LIKPKEYDILNAISQDSTITQLGLASRLGMAVGSVNWYLKRLINRGFVKVSQLDRTRLKYDLTPEGMSVFSERATQYVKDSLKTYKLFRKNAKNLVSHLKADGITEVYLHGDDEIMDIFRLTCLETGIVICGQPCEVMVKTNGQKYEIIS
jgi:DNA-binding MarR family transcriptional regulator